MYTTTTLAVFTFLAGQIVASPLVPFLPPSSLLFPRAPSCPISSPSCQSTTGQQDSCCVETPGGLIAQTQFWDLNTAGSPSDRWTIHGLWPDNCRLGSNGQVTWPTNCDPTGARNYSGMKQILIDNGKSELVDFMLKFWLQDKGNHEAFWKHEWNEHGVCMSTLKPNCLPPSSKRGADAAIYFQRAVDLWKTVDTYSFLAEAGVLPSQTQKYSLSQLTNAIKAKHGVTPAIDCRNGVISQIFYYFNLKGSLIDGSFIPVEPIKPGSCPADNISYPPKNGAPAPTPVSTPASTLTGTATSADSTQTGLSSRATISATKSDGTSTGCLLAAGTWSTQTCATMTIIPADNGFSFKSSRGNCAIVAGALTCGNSVGVATIFTATTSNGQTLVSFQGSTAFTADSIPSGSRQVTVFTGSDKANDISLVIEPISG